MREQPEEQERLRAHRCIFVPRAMGKSNDQAAGCFRRFIATARVETCEPALAYDPAA
jgi:hypothetical protein